MIRLLKRANSRVGQTKTVPPKTIRYVERASIDTVIKHLFYRYRRLQRAELLEGEEPVLEMSFEFVKLIYAS